MRSSFVSILVLASSTGIFALGPEYSVPWQNWPSCAKSCMSAFTNSNCAGNGVCFCSDGTAISNANSCIDSSTCSTSDKQAIYQNIAQLCADVGFHVTAAPESTYRITTSSSLTGGPWSSGAWGGNGWGGGYGGPGYGPFGGNWGPWGSSGAWTTGPWSAWWDGSACPPDTWTGWTSGTWSANAPWTTWTACTATTTATTTFTTTSSGTVVTGTAFGVKVAEQTSARSSGSVVVTKTSSALAGTNVAKMGLRLIVVTFVVIVQG